MTYIVLQRTLFTNLFRMQSYSGVKPIRMVYFSHFVSPSSSEKPKCDVFKRHLRIAPPKSKKPKLRQNIKEVPLKYKDLKETTWIRICAYFSPKSKTPPIKFTKGLFMHTV